MFRIENGPDGGLSGRLFTYVVDHDRDVWLKFVSGIGSEPGSVMKLVWEGRIIPFDYYVENLTSEPRPRLIGRIENFGTSWLAGYKGDLKVFHFSSETERKSAELLAAEALLVFGSMYDGLSFPDGMYTVELNTAEGVRHYTLSDFGYTTEATEDS